MRLFSAWSIVNNFIGYDEVVFNWFYAEREKHLAAYKELIANYHHLDEVIKPYMEDYVNELFTEEEIKALRAYLSKRSPAGRHFRCKGHYQTQQIELFVAEMPLPIREPARDKNIILRNATHSGGLQDKYIFSNEDGYDLPFKVYAYHDLRDCPRIPNTSNIYDSDQRGIDGRLNFCTPGGIVNVHTYRKPFYLLCTVDEINSKPTNIYVMTVVNSLVPAYCLGWEYRNVMAQCPVAYFGNEIFCHYKSARELRPMSQFETNTIS